MLSTFVSDISLSNGMKLWQNWNYYLGESLDMGCPTADSRAREVDAISDHKCPLSSALQHTRPVF
jgi:hypothetical protein